jgi:hypothetical protein
MKDDSPAASGTRTNGPQEDPDQGDGVRIAFENRLRESRSPAFGSFRGQSSGVLINLRFREEHHAPWLHPFGGTSRKGNLCTLRFDDNRFGSRR